MEEIAGECAAVRRGGGDNNKALQTRCRQGFSEFVRKAGLGGRMPRIVACGGRQQAFESFRIAHELYGSVNPAVLLVDSESTVRSPGAWAHVRSQADWRRPVGAEDDQLHLMVQAMEAWFHADHMELHAFYGQYFRADALSRRTPVEEIPVGELLAGLREATANCQKGKYSKGEHSFQILGRIDPLKVSEASPSCARFLGALQRLCAL